MYFSVIRELAPYISRIAHHIEQAKDANIEFLRNYRLDLPLCVTECDGEIISLMRRKFFMPLGTVKFFDAAKGYGFIAMDTGGKDAVVQAEAVTAAGMQSLTKNDRLSYDIDTDPRGQISAVNLRPA